MTQTAETGTDLVSKVATAAQYGGPAITVGSATKQYFGYTLDEWSLIGIFTGIALGVFGFVTTQVVNIYFKRQHLRLAQMKAGEFYDE